MYDDDDDDEGRFNLNVCDKNCRKLSALMVHRRSQLLRTNTEAHS